jgi:AcrR family transcriptional regulator
MASLTRKEREKAEHRQLVLEAAEVVFASKSYHEATVQEIAEGAEFSVGSIYNLFESKAAILAELVAMRTEEFAADVEARMGRESDVLGKVRAAIAAKMDFFQRHQRFFLIFGPFREHGRLAHRPGIPAELRRRYWDYIARLADLFAEGIRQGAFVAEDPMTLALCMEGMTNAAIACSLHGANSGVLAAPDAIQRVFLRGALAEGRR